MLARIPGGSHWLRLALVAGAIVSAACSDRPPVAPRIGAANRARLSMSANFQKMPPGGPVIDAKTVSVVLYGPTGDSVVKTATFDANGIAVLEFEFPLFAPTQFRRSVTAFDANGTKAFAYVDTIAIKPGDNTNLPEPQLVYAAPDAGLQTLRVSPASLQLNANGTAALSVSGTGAGGAPISDIRVGWSSKDGSIATVDANGAVRAGTLHGSTYVVATTALDKKDSALVRVSGVVARVVTAPASLSIPRGGTGAVTAEMRDAANHLIDDRSATFTSSDNSIATVTSAGVVRGVAVGTATITATSDGKSGTIPVTVVSPVDHIELTPAALTFASLGETGSVSAKIVAVPGGAIDGFTIDYSSSNANVASVDASGTVTARANGAATITASTDGKSATATVTVKQQAVSISVSPASNGVTALGASRTFTATAVDARGNPIAEAATWTSSDPSVATVENGVTVGRKTGTTTITATIGGKSASASFTVAQVPVALSISFEKNPMRQGTQQRLRPVFVDAGGTPVPGGSASFSSSNASVISVTSDGLATAVGQGSATITASAGPLTSSLSLSVVSPTGGTSGLNVTPTTVEKLPGGTQQFAVSGGTGPFTWSVNGVDGGNSTFGTISTTGFYTAPSSVPNPASFDVCAAQGASRGCARVTINPIPTSGADVIVFNDLNMFDSPGESDVNNQTLFRNLVNFTGSGARASQTKVMFFFGHSSNGQFGYFTMRNTISAAGYTITDVFADLTSPIDPAYKVVFLWLPRTNFSTTEINNLKTFSAQGGRIVFVGEYAGYYGAGIAVENAFFSAMGAQMTNTGGQYDCGFAVEPASRLRSHQVMAGVNQITLACASEIVPGPNDYAFLYDQTGTRVLGAAAKVDVTPISSLMAPSFSRQVKQAPADTVRRDPKDPAGRPLPP